MRAEQSARASLVQAQTHARLIITLAKGKHITSLKEIYHFLREQKTLVSGGGTKDVFCKCFVREKWLDKVFLCGIIVERKMAYEQRKFL